MLFVRNKNCNGNMKKINKLNNFSHTRDTAKIT